MTARISEGFRGVIERSDGQIVWRGDQRSEARTAKRC